MENPLAVIEKKYASLSKGQRRIADYIRRSCDDAAFMTAARLGRTVNVSESTVVRFSYTLGFDGYPALQTALQETNRLRLTGAQRARLMQNVPPAELQRRILCADMANLRRTIEMVDAEQFENAVDAICCARHVYVLGLGSASALAGFFCEYLSYVLEDVINAGAASDPQERILHMTADDLFFAVSFPRYSARTYRCMQQAAKSGATLLALTDRAESPIAEISDYVLLARSDMASFADSLTAPLSMLNAIIAAVGQARPDRTVRHLMRLENLWAREDAYLSDEHLPKEENP